MEYGFVKTTIDIPDRVFRQAKATAAECGQTLGTFVAEALREKLARGSGTSGAEEPPWMKGFGKLRPLRRETVRIQRAIDREFETVEPESRRTTPGSPPSRSSIVCR
jgi:hypothetical protein